MSRDPRAILRALTALVPTLVLVGVCATACGGDDSGQNDTSATGSKGTSSSSAPVTQDTGNPFTATLTGPDTAETGETITVTLTNTGRLPNQFQLEFEPSNAAVATPRAVALAAGQSAELQVQVQVSPFNINVESASGGLGDFIATLEVGSTS